MQIEQCPYCGSNNLTKYLDINLPILEKVVPEDILSQIQNRRLVAKLCLDCLLGFNATPVEEEILEKIYKDFYFIGYISPFEGIGNTKFQGIIELIKKNVSKNEKIMEIGCGDGYLLYKLKELGYINTLGIEPSDLCEYGKKEGIKIYKTLLTEEVLRDVQGSDVFLMVHVLEHFKDPFSTLKLLKKYLNPAGKIIIEVPNFEGYIHEHLYFFNKPFMHRLASDLEFEIIEEEYTDDIIRIVFSAANCLDKKRDNYNFYEEAKKLIDYATRRQKLLEETVKKLETIIKENSQNNIYIWGAGSLAIDLLNQIDVEVFSRSNIKVIDGDKRKWGMFLPGVGLRVEPFITIKEDKTPKVLIIMSSFYNEILKTINENGIKAEKIEVFTRL